MAAFCLSQLGCIALGKKHLKIVQHPILQHLAMLSTNNNKCHRAGVISCKMCTGMCCVGVTNLNSVNKNYSSTCIFNNLSAQSLHLQQKLNLYICLIHAAAC